MSVADLARDPSFVGPYRVIGTLGEAFRARGGGKIDRYLQPDGGIPAGFAGGALFDLHGRVLGLNTPALHPEAGLTIPTTTLERRKQAEALREGEPLLRQYCAGAAFVIPSSVVRGTLTAILWLQPPAYESVVVPTFGEADAWVKQRLPTV